MDLKKIGQYIAGKRKGLGLTQVQLAEKLGMSDKSVSKWERGVCLPDVSVYTELCSILGISLNEFIAGQDLEENKVVAQSEDNLIQVAKDYKKRTGRLRKVALLFGTTAAVLAVVLILVLCYTRRPTNTIAPFDQNSKEMETAKILSITDDVFLFRYNVDTSYRKMAIYLTEYEKDKVIKKEEEASLDLIEGDDRTGILGFTTDFDHHQVNIVDYFDGFDISFETDILRGVKGWEYYGRTASQMKGKLKIAEGKELPVLALYFGKNQVASVPLEELMNDRHPDADHTYLYTVAFTK